MCPRDRRNYEPTFTNELVGKERGLVGSLGLEHIKPRQASRGRMKNDNLPLRTLLPMGNGCRQIGSRRLAPSPSLGPGDLL